jgi:hypothetical protein
MVSSIREWVSEKVSRKKESEGEDELSIAKMRLWLKEFVGIETVGEHGIQFFEVSVEDMEQLWDTSFTPQKIDGWNEIVSFAQSHSDEVVLYARLNEYTMVNEEDDREVIEEETVPDNLVVDFASIVFTGELTDDLIVEFCSTVGHGYDMKVDLDVVDSEDPEMGAVVQRGIGR